jgi:hypothetical protein
MRYVATTNLHPYGAEASPEIRSRYYGSTGETLDDVDELRATRS